MATKKKKVRREKIIQSICRKIGIRRADPKSQYVSRPELLAILAALESDEE